MNLHFHTRPCSSIVLLILCLLFFSEQDIQAAPRFEIKDFKTGVDLSKEKKVLIIRGDNDAYRVPGHNDSGWDLVSLPSNWYTLYPDWNRICWYRIHVTFPKKLPDRSPGISLGMISDIDEVYFNGNLIGRSGKFPPSRESAYDKIRIYEIPTHLIRPGKDNVVAIRVQGLFPHEAGLHKGTYRIGLYSGLHKDYISKEFLQIFFVFVYLSVGLYFGILSMGLSFAREFLFFSLLTLCSAMYLFLRTQIKYIFFSNFLILKRFEYLFLFIILVFLMEFITFYFRKKHVILHYLYYVITFVALGSLFAFNDPVVWNRVLFSLVEPSWAIPIFYSLAVSFRERRLDKDSMYILASFSIIFLVMLNDILVDRGVYNFVQLATYTYWIIVVGIALVMRKRFARLYDKALLLRSLKGKKREITGEVKEKLDSAIEYLEKNYTSDISREGLAETQDLHHDYFGRIFKLYTGMKIGEYINQLRIKKAEEMLLSDNVTITDIAFSVGFESLSTFYRVFQKINGESPSSYQKRLKNK